MKIKLDGRCFKNAMEVNQITLEGEEIKIHNSNENGMGFIHSYKSPIAIPDKVDFTLNKKDYTLLSTQESFYLEKQNSTIIIIGDHMKAKFADLTIRLTAPMLEDMTPLAIEFKDLLHGKPFINLTDTARPQYGGITIRHGRIMASDSYCIYQKNIDFDGKEINIPKEVFKYLGNRDYKIKTNGRAVIFEFEDTLFYSKVIEFLLGSMMLDSESVVEFTINKKDLLDKLKILKEYGRIISMSAMDKILTLSTETNENKITVSLDLVPVSLTELEFKTDVNQLIKMITMIDDEDVSIRFTDKMVKVVWQNVITASARVGNGCKVIGGAS